LGVKYVKQKDKILVGFREKGHGRFLADLDICLTLANNLGQQLPALGQLIMGLDCYQHVPQIEVAMGDQDLALVFRHLQELSASDRRALQSFGEAKGWQIYSQAAGPDSVVPLWPEQPPSLYYSLPMQAIRLQFQPLDFIQINADINIKLIKLVHALLDVQPSDLVLDLFCGLGNFSLPLAKQARRVLAMEGEPDLIQRGRDNAKLNGIENIEFHQADLQKALVFPQVDKIVIDPPRCGAKEVLAAAVRTGASKIVYVSCNPATLARDAGILLHDYGMQLKSAGVLDMFPHTGHVESIALFEPAHN
jgi:23S rRNA (uracil1939-C5)-methyltransferase